MDNEKVEVDVSPSRKLLHPMHTVLNETLFCGRVSGRKHDQFKEAGLTPLPARKVRSPAITECVAHIECKVHNQFDTGDHTIFVGEIVEAYADKDAFTVEYKLAKARMIFHVGGNKFATLNTKVSRPKLKPIRS